MSKNTFILELVPKNYKIVVQVVLGQNDQGAGVRIVARCLWDASTDDLVSQIFTNVTILSVLQQFCLIYFSSRNQFSAWLHAAASTDLNWIY
jgi:Tctex-1 family